MSGHPWPWPVYEFNRLRAAGIGSPREMVPPVDPWWSRQVGCREAPSNHPWDKRVRAQADGQWSCLALYSWKLFA